jgi:hypothetical protein
MVELLTVSGLFCASNAPEEINRKTGIDFLQFICQRFIFHFQRCRFAVPNKSPFSGRFEGYNPINFNPEIET